MKRLLALLALLTFSTTLSLSQGGVKNIDTVQTKDARLKTMPIPVDGHGVSGVSDVRSDGDHLYLVTDDTTLQLDGQTTSITSDTTINVTLSGATYTLKVDSTVMQSIHNGILRAKAGISVVYSNTGPDSVGIDSGYTATKADLDNINNGWFGDGSDGSRTLAADSTLTRDAYFLNLTLNAGIDINVAGWRIFVKDTLSVSSTSAIRDTGVAGNNGAAGGNQTASDGTASAGAGGGAAAGLADGYLARWAGGTLNGAGGANPGGSGQNGNAGGSGTVITFSINDSGNWGGRGGNSGAYTDGAGGAGGDTTVMTAGYGRARDFFAQYLNRVFNLGFPGSTSQFRNGGYPGGGGGGAMGSGTSGAGIRNGGAGGGGAGGQNAGTVWIAARVITGSGTFDVKGGKGGDGGVGGNASGAATTNYAGSGGGGGGGGTGGLLAVFYKILSASITLTYSGGVGGTGGIGGTGSGNGATNGGAGNNGETGTTGLLFLFKL